MLLTVLLAMTDARGDQRLSRLLTQSGAQVLKAGRSRPLNQLLDQGEADLVLVHERRLPADPGRWIGTLHSLPERPEVIVLGERENAARRAALLAAGCLSVLNLNLPDAGLQSALQTLLARRSRVAPAVLEEERPRLEYQLRDFVSDSPAMHRFLDVAQRVAAAESAVLLLGETGVGKEHLARAIHRDGPRGRGAFLAVNCAALPETLLESELFGHERGAFTGATRTRKGYFELAHGGTIFLDEIAEVPLHLQAKLLRVLDDHGIQRIGSETSIRVDVRIMAATNRDLEAEVAAGRFRRDLYYRLAVVTLELPPLRERREDIPSLIHSYNRQSCLAMGRPVKAIAPGAEAALVAYAWPGNVRELINVMERAVILATGDEIGLGDLPGAVARSGASRNETRLPLAPSDMFAQLADLWGGLPLKEARRLVQAGFDREYLTRVLSAQGGRIGDTAAQAGINERSLYNLMRDLKLPKEQFQAGPE